jgi:hypothetical protein
MTTSRRIFVISAMVLTLVLAVVYCITPEIVTGAAWLAASGAQQVWDQHVWAHPPTPGITQAAPGPPERVAAPNPFWPYGHDVSASGIDPRWIAALAGAPCLWLICSRTRKWRSRNRMEERMAKRLAQAVRRMTGFSSAAGPRRRSPADPRRAGQGWAEPGCG